MTPSFNSMDPKIQISYPFHKSNNNNNNNDIQSPPKPLSSRRRRSNLVSQDENNNNKNTSPIRNNNPRERNNNYSKRNGNRGSESDEGTQSFELDNDYKIEQHPQEEEETDLVRSTEPSHLPTLMVSPPKEKGSNSLLANN